MGPQARPAGGPQEVVSRAVVGLARDSLKLARGEPTHKVRWSYTSDVLLCIPGQSSLPAASAHRRPWDTLTLGAAGWEIAVRVISGLEQFLPKRGPTLGSVGLHTGCRRGGTR